MDRFLHWKCTAGERDQNCTGKFAVRPVFHGFIPSGPELTSMVMAMKMMIMTALTMMLVMMMLAMAMIMQPWPLGLLVEVPAGPRSARGASRNSLQPILRSHLRPPENGSKSPDLNPVEMFWGWLRKKLRSMDLQDLRKKRCPLGKTAYTARVKGVLKSAKVQTAAKNVASRLRKACKQVVDRNGAAADK